MEISIKRNSDSKIVYSQLVEGSDTALVNKVIAEATGCPVGDELTTTVVNNGHALSFSTAHPDKGSAYVGAIVRAVNGIKTVTRAAKSETA